MKETLEAPIKERQLTALDQCDNKGCPSRAVTIAYMDMDDLELFFCGHHTRQHEPALVGQGFSLYKNEVAK